MRRLIVFWLVSTVVTGALVGCNRHAAGEHLTQLSCASQTYRIAADKIDATVNDACERVKQSAEALKAYRATVARFTCQASDGHVLLSLLAPHELFDDYEKNCQQFRGIDDAFRGHTIDIQAHHEGSREFTARNNELARSHGEHDNVLYRQRQADLVALSRLIKERGGSIEIRD
jgi:hypothetical protein